MPIRNRTWSARGTDTFEGLYQNETGSGMIGDNPYAPNSTGILDNYPLMMPWTTTTLHILGDVNSDGKVDLVDLVLLANAYGSRIGDAKWSPSVDIDGNARAEASVVLKAEIWPRVVSPL